MSFNSSHYLQSRLSLWLSVSLEAEGDLKDGCMTSCHSALTPTSVPSLCISVTCVLWRWPAPINHLSALLPRPHLALSALPSPPLPSLFFWLFLPLSSPHTAGIPESSFPFCPCAAPALRMSISGQDGGMGDWARLSMFVAAWALSVSI